MPSLVKGDLIDMKIHECRECDRQRYPYHNMIRPCYGTTFPERVEECYTPARYPGDVVVLSEIIPYPKRILDGCRTSSVSRVFMGALPFLEYMYCIIDNSLNCWKLYNTEKIEQITEKDCRDIIHVAAGYRDHSIFIREVQGVIVYCTEKFLKTSSFCGRERIANVPSANEHAIFLTVSRTIEINPGP